MHTHAHTPFLFLSYSHKHIFKHTLSVMLSHTQSSTLIGTWFSYLSLSLIPILSPILSFECWKQLGLIQKMVKSLLRGEKSPESNRCEWLLDALRHHQLGIEFTSDAFIWIRFTVALIKASWMIVPCWKKAFWSSVATICNWVLSLTGYETFFV